MSFIFLVILFLRSHQDLHMWSHPEKPWELRPSAQDCRPQLPEGQSSQPVNWVFTLSDSEPFDPFQSHSLNCFCSELLSLHYWEALAERLISISLKWFVCKIKKILSNKSTYYFRTRSVDCCLQGLAMFQLKGLQVAQCHILCCDSIFICWRHLHILFFVSFLSHTTLGTTNARTIPGLISKSGLYTYILLIMILIAFGQVKCFHSKMTQVYAGLWSIFVRGSFPFLLGGFNNTFQI